MSYENPQAVVDTESAKYFAQGLTNLGQNAVKIINAEGDRERAQAKAWKKQNLENTKNRIKFGSEYLALVNKVLPDFDMATEISPQLNELIDHAADVKTRLGNMTQGNSGYAELKDELNALESYFSVGLKQGLENFSGQRQEYSAGQVSIGSEMTTKDGKITNLGLSASQNQPQRITDTLSTMEGSSLIPRRFAIKRFKGKDGKLGAYGTYGIFGEPSKEVKGVNIAARALGVDTSKLGARTYNFNTDFGGSSVITNPNITQTLNDLLESQKITKGDNLNYINGKPSQELQNLFEDQTVQNITKTSVGTITREMPVINYDRLKAKVSNGLESRVGGIVKAGQAIEGDLGIGMLRIQSYVDDILTDELDDFVGTLESDPSTKSGLTKDSYARLEEAIVKTKQENLSNGLVAISESETLNNPKLTENETKLQEKQSDLSSLSKALIDFDTQRPGADSGIRMDIIPDSRFQQELLKIGPGFTFNKISKDNGKDFINLKVVGDPDSDGVQLPLSKLTDVALKQVMYLLAGGKSTDKDYKILANGNVEETQDQYDVFAR